MSQLPETSNVMSTFPCCKKAYGLDDMQHASGEASFIRKPSAACEGEKAQECCYAFFPGCQLGAAEPEIVIKAYDSILFQLPDTGIFLKCCGLPALLEQDTAAFEENIAQIQAEWERLGCPSMIMACSTCIEVFNSFLPQITTISLYDFISEHGISGGCNSVDYILYRGHSNSKSTESSSSEDNIIKALAEDMGVTFHPFDEDDSYPYITDCIDCRDMLKKQGKEAVHILELIYGMGESNEHMAHEHEHEHEQEKNKAPLRSVPLPSQNQRRGNRIQLKELLEALYWRDNI